MIVKDLLLEITSHVWLPGHRLDHRIFLRANFFIESANCFFTRNIEHCFIKSVTCVTLMRLFRFETIARRVQRQTTAKLDDVLTRKIHQLEAYARQIDTSCQYNPPLKLLSMQLHYGQFSRPIQRCACPLSAGLRWAASGCYQLVSRLNKTLRLGPTWPDWVQWQCDCAWSQLNFVE